MKFQFSAGGIVYKKRPVRQAQGKQAKSDPFDKLRASKRKAEMLILVSQHSQHHGWVFPKGLIGDKVKSEKKEDTALREVREEGGIVGKIREELPPVTYWFKLEGELVRKTVHYFLMEYVSGDIKNHDYEMEKVEWLPILEVEERLTYKSDKEAWKEAKKLLIHGS